MRKKVVLLSVLGLASGSAMAQSSVTLYGVLDTGISYLSNVQTGRSGTALAGHSQLAMTDGGALGRGGSRWGLKGSEALGGGWSAIFTLENGFNVPAGTFSQGGAEFGRQAFVGLKGPAGALTLGRQYAPAFDVMKDFTPTHIAGIAGSSPGDIDGAEGTRRINNAVKFASTPMRNVNVSGLYAFGGQAGNVTAQQTMSIAASFTGAPLSFGVAYFNARDPNLSAFGNNPNSGNASVDNLGSAGSATAAQSSPIYAGFSSAHTFQIENAGASYTTGPLWLGLSYSHAGFGDLGNTGSGPNPFGYRGNASFNNLTAALSYQLGGVVNLGGAYTYTRAGGVGGHDGATYQQAILEGQYSLSKRTQLYIEGVYQTASGTNSLGQPAVASIELLTPSATNRQLLTRVGIFTTF